MIILIMMIMIMMMIIGPVFIIEEESFESCPPDRVAAQVVDSIV